MFAGKLTPLQQVVASHGSVGSSDGQPEQVTPYSPLRLAKVMLRRACQCPSLAAVSDQNHLLHRSQMAPSALLLARG